MPHMPSIAEQSAVMARERDKPQPRLIPATAIDDAVRQAVSFPDLALRVPDMSADV